MLFYKKTTIFLFLAGLFGALAFPPISFPLCWFLSLGVLLGFLWEFFSRGQKKNHGFWPLFLKGFKGSWVWFFGLYIGTLHWIPNGCWADPRAYGWVYPLGLILAPAYLSLYGAFGCGLTLVTMKGFQRSTTKKFFQKTQGEGVFFFKKHHSKILQILFPFVFSFFYGAQEWIKGHGFLCFPWNLTAYIWAKHLAMAQGAYYFGSYGLGHITLLLLCFFWLSLVFFPRSLPEKIFSPWVNFLPHRKKPEESPLGSCGFLKFFSKLRRYIFKGP